MLETTSRHRDTWIRAQECPFCRTSLTYGTTKNQFISHVGRHLQYVSHAAVPPSAMRDDSIEVEENVDDDASEKAAHGDSHDDDLASATESSVEVPELQQNVPSKQLTSIAGKSDKRRSLLFGCYLFCTKHRETQCRANHPQL